MPRLKSKAGKDAAAAEKTESSKSVLESTSGAKDLAGNEEDNEAGDTTTFKIPYDEKFIICQRMGHDGSSTGNRPSLIFTHGAGGGIDTPSTKLFCEGFARLGNVLVFQGTMNLQSRFKMFQDVIEHEGSCEVLGGSSMGARAAVMTAQQQTASKSLILVSYPLTSKKDVRDKILLDLQAHHNILFISGDHDEMCDIDHLNQVRKKMKAQTWLVIIQGADHGMSIKPKHAVEDMRRRIGEIAAGWLRSRSDKHTELVLCWNKEKNELEPVNGTMVGFDGGASTLNKRKRDTSPQVKGK